MRSTLETAPMPPVTSEVRCCAERCLLLVALHKVPSRRAMPMARSTSMLRRLASANAKRCAPAPPASRAGRARQGLGQERQRDQDDGADQRGEADPEMEDETQPEIKRHPRQVEQRARPGAREKGAQLVEIAHALQAVRPSRGSAAAARWSRRRPARSAPHRARRRSA